MGLFSSLLPAIGGVAGSFIPGVGTALGTALGGALGGALGSGAQQSGTATSTTQQQLDPRAQAILYGDGTDANKGLLSQYQQFLGQPQGAGTSMLGAASQNWLNAAAPNVLNQLYSGSSSLLSPMQAPQAQAPHAIDPTGMGNVLWNTGESFSAPSDMRAAQVGMPQQVQGAMAQAPGAWQASMAGASQVQAPPQNNMDLTGAYQHFVSGASGDNPYLSNSLLAGIDAGNAGYNKNVNTLAQTLQRQILPGIRSNSILSGQYGSSRQGIAEGNALSDFTRQLNDNNLALGTQNSANVTGQLANTYNQGQDRALSATQGLGAQQYGVAQQNSAQQQQTNLANAAAANSSASQSYQGGLTTALQNAQNQQQAALANQGANLQAGTTNANLQQQAGLNNYAGNLQATQQSAANRQQANLANQQVGNNASQFNANQIQNAAQFNNGQQQQTNLANLQAQLGTNSLNSSNTMGGLGALSGLLSGVYGYGQNADNYQLNRATQVNGLLSPYLGMGGSSTSSQPLYTNPSANILGGAASGLGIYSQLKNLGGLGGNAYNPTQFAANNAGVLAANPGMSMNDVYSIFQ